MVAKSLSAFTAASLRNILLFLLLIIRHSEQLASLALDIHRPSTQRYRRLTNDRQKITTVRSVQTSEEAPTNTLDIDIKQQQSQPQSQIAAVTANNAAYKEVWKPPSQKTTRGYKIFSIQQPQDLLDFVIEDERLSVIKVYASWCKTCKVFDVRYRKLANRLGGGGDDDNNLQSETSLVRFAEMQYDNPNNTEMCQLLNATKLPHILIYRGHQGKVADFQCTPANFQLLIDTVNGLLSNGNKLNGIVGSTNATIQSQLLSNDTISSSSDEVVSSLKEQLVELENEKIEMFEIMKAQIEVDKEEIETLVNCITLQKSVIETKDEEIRKSLGMITSKDDELEMMNKNMNEKVKECKVMMAELVSYKSQVDELKTRIDESERIITTMKSDAVRYEKETKEKEGKMKELESEWERQRILYEEERRSVRKMAILTLKRIGTKIRSFLLSRKEQE
jgi:thiol-disulfide isomerase/thioredoxin